MDKKRYKANPSVLALIKEKQEVEMEQQNKLLQLMAFSIATENMDLKTRIQNFERKRLDMEKTLQNLKKGFES